MKAASATGCASSTADHGRRRSASDHRDAADRTGCRRRRSATRTRPPTIGTASSVLNSVSATNWTSTTCQFAAVTSAPRLRRFQTTRASARVAQHILQCTMRMTFPPLSRARCAFVIALGAHCRRPPRAGGRAGHRATPARRRCRGVRARLHRAEVEGQFAALVGPARQAVRRVRRRRRDGAPRRARATRGARASCSISWPRQSRPEPDRRRGHNLRRAESAGGLGRAVRGVPDAG